MKKSTLPMIVGSVLLMSSLSLSHRAEACGGGNSNYSGAYAAAMTALVVGGSVIAGDLALTTVDIVRAAKDKPASKGLGIAEVALGAPQVALGLYGLSQSHDGSAAATFTVFTVWTAALVAHGVWSIASSGSVEPTASESVVAQAGSPGPEARAQSATEPAPRAALSDPPVRFAVAPTMVAVANQHAPGLALAVSF